MKIVFSCPSRRCEGREPGERERRVWYFWADLHAMLHYLDLHSLRPQVKMRIDLPIMWPNTNGRPNRNHVRGRQSLGTGRAS